MTIKIYFKNNQGSFAIDAISETLRGNWSEKSSTDDFGIVTNVNPDNREWAEDMLKGDENVDSYTIIDEA